MKPNGGIRVDLPLKKKSIFFFLQKLKENSSEQLTTKMIYLMTNALENLWKLRMIAL